MSLTWTSYAFDEPQIEELIPALDLRASRRISVRYPVRLWCESEAGRHKMLTGRMLNLSASGALVEASRPIAVGSRVRIETDERQAGAAYVRHSTPRSWGFGVGLEFVKGD